MTWAILHYRVRGGIYRAEGSVYRWLGVSYTNYNDVQRIKAHHNQYRVVLAAVPGFTRVTGKPLSKMLMRLQPATPVDLPIRSPVSCLLVIGHFL